MLEIVRCAKKKKKSTIIIPWFPSRTTDWFIARHNITYAETFAPSSFNRVNFKKEKTIHFVYRPILNRTTKTTLFATRPINRSTASIHGIREKHRTSGSFEAEWKPGEIGSCHSSSVIRFLQRIRNPRMTAHRAPSCPVMNRILIAAKRSRIAVIRFGLLSIYNEHVVPLRFPCRIVRLHWPLYLNLKNNQTLSRFIGSDRIYVVYNRFIKRRIIIFSFY